MISSIATALLIIFLVVLGMALLVAISNIFVVLEIFQLRGRTLSDVPNRNGEGGRPTGLLNVCGSNLVLKHDKDGKVIVIDSVSVSAINPDLLLLR